MHILAKVAIGVGITGVVVFGIKYVVDSSAAAAANANTSVVQMPYQSPPATDAGAELARSLPGVIGGIANTIIGANVTADADRRREAALVTQRAHELELARANHQNGAAP